MAQEVDVAVLGAGFVGLGTALALQERGVSVALVDRRGPAEETSFGNAGLLQAEAVVPYAFPRSARVVASALFDRRVDSRLHWRSLPHTMRFLLAYAAHSGPAAVERTARANSPLVHAAVPSHRRLVEAAGAGALWREGGYLRLFRSPRVLERAVAESTAHEVRYGVPFAPLDGAALARAEPHVAPLAGAIHHPSPVRIEDPGALGAAYARLFEARGGTLLRGDASTLTPRSRGFRLACEAVELHAREAVVALGAWSGPLLRRFGVRVPLGVKRGYHMHYAPRGNAGLSHLVVDEERGYVVAPNTRGLRLTTGAEFAAIDAPHTPLQVDRAEAEARAILPIGARRDETAWRGARPCLPDLLPVIGRVPGVPGLWANFGHHHLGLTLGPATGGLLAAIMTGATPFTDPHPYRVERFTRSR